MRIAHVIIGAALMAAFVIGCSKSSSPQPPHPASTPPNTKGLGAVELTAKTPMKFDLGDGKICTITGRQIPIGIALSLVLLTTNPDGTVTRSQGEIVTRPGEPCTIGLGGTMVELTPTLKTQ